MKLKALFLALLLGLTTSSMAIESGKIIFNIEGGYGISISSGEVVVNPGESASSKTDSAYGFGANFGYFLTEDIAFMLGLGYSGKNWKIEITGGGPNEGIYTYKPSFVEISAGIKGFSGIIFWGGGLYYGITSKKFDITIETGGVSVTVNTKDTGIDKYVKNPFGLYGEIGVAWPLDDAILFELGAKFQLGLTPFFDTSEDYTDADKYKVSALTLKAGISFLF